MAAAHFDGPTAGNLDKPVIARFEADARYGSASRLRRMVEEHPFMTFSKRKIT
jgi:hypothetical protein